ncbi:putative ABC transporter related [Candidatus Sulfopaludibacter sp. SbA3]|nr:putative ABC transporter related [Candidatus Sulfopaludibacter sp. SbA3]
MTPVLEFQSVARSYTKGKPVLDGVSFAMAPGEVVGLLGRNGAGKTTLIRIAMGMLFPHAGAVRVFGLSPIEDAVAVKKRVGYVAEDQVLPPGSSIAELTELHRYLFPRWDSVLESELLGRFALDPAARIKSLSKGQARQVALLCAVCHRPELLILDEPAGGLDPAARREFLETSIQLLNREGTSILFSSHHMTDVERIGGRVVLLDAGKVRLDRDLDRLREDVCVAMLPRGSAPDTATLERLPGCLNARPVFDDWHAVFEGAPEAVQQQLNESLGVNGTRCVRVPLEELFIEMVGSDR